MPVSTESTTAVRISSDFPTLTFHYWQCGSIEGPADLYRGFALDAVDAFLKTQEKIDDEQYGFLLSVVDVALSVALKAAHVEESWLPLYQEATAHLNKSDW